MQFIDGWTYRAVYVLQSEIHVQKGQREMCIPCIYLLSIYNKCIHIGIHVYIQQKKIALSGHIWVLKIYKLYIHKNMCTSNKQLYTYVRACLDG